MVRDLSLLTLAIAASLAVTMGRVECASNEDHAWGEAIGGVQCRLLQPEDAWELGQPLRLQMEVRNTGAKKWARHTHPAMQCQVEVDGTWFKWVGQTAVRAGKNPFPPAPVEKEASRVPIEVDWAWVSDAGQHLKPSPGEHTLRVAIPVIPLQNQEAKPARIVSNVLKVKVAAVVKDSAPVSKWGPAKEGVQVRLRLEQKQWALDATPKLLADVKNDGKRELHIVQAQQLCEIEVDGRWFRWVGPIHLKSSWFPPGRQYNDIPVSLTRNWQTKAGDTPLALAEGRHTIRVAFTARPLNAKRPKGKPVRAVSNPVEIKLTAASKE